MRSRILALAGMLVLLASGCGQRGPLGPEMQREPSPPSVESGETPAVLTIELAGAAATTYRADEDGGSDTRLARRLRSRFPTVRVDPCLERAASAYAHATVEHGERLPLAFTEFVLHWAGCPDPTAAVTILLTDSNGDEVLLDNLADVVSDGGYTQLGAARAPAEAPYRWRWVVFLVARRFTMVPAATAGEPGETLPLQFRIGPGFVTARVWVSRPRGEIREHSAGLSGGWAVAAVPLADDIGRQWVELVADSEQGPQVLALFPVEVGRPPPTMWIGERRADESVMRTAEQAEIYAADLVARDRERFGLPRLELDPRLAEIARRHSADMAEEQYFAHFSPTTGAVMDRLRTARYPARFAAENLARSGNLADAHEGLMRSPGHRAAILSPEATHYGVGVVVDFEDGSERVFHITQIFAVPAVPVDAALLSMAIAERISGHHGALGTNMAAHDDPLSVVAHRIAAALARSHVVEADLDAIISSELQRMQLYGVRWRVLSGEAYTADDVELPESVAEANVDRFGVGVAQPNDSGAIRPATYVVVMLTGER